MSLLLVTFRTPRSQAPFLDRSYPASTVLRACPPPQTTRPVPRGSPVGSRDLPSQGLPVLPVVTSFMHAVATTPVGSQGIRRSVLPRHGQEAHHPTTTAFPVIQAGRLPHYPFRGLLSVHSRSACMLADSLKEPFLGVLQSNSLPPQTAPSATGWSNKMPGGFRTHWKRHAFHGTLRNSG